MGPHLFIVLLIATLASAALPLGWKACKRSDKEYEKCLIRAITHAVGTLINGEKKLGVHALDPLRISSLQIPQKPGPVNINLSFKNFDIHGIRNIKFDEETFRNDWKDLSVIAKIPDIIIIGEYKIDGKVLVLPITGQGKCNLTLHELTLKIKVNWKQIEKGGKKYFQMEKMQMELIPERLYIHLENLFNGDKALGDNMNVFMNENWEPIGEEMLPGFGQALSQAFSQIANAALSRIPASEIDKP